jgi:acyl-CoA synthetase (AMP-forming)/AMP-acid ligase II
VATFTSWLADLVAAHAGRTALHQPGGDPVTYAELDCRVAGLAGMLAAAGLARGDRLASFVPNGILAVELLLAAARLGATTIGVNTRYRSEDLRHVLEVARPSVLVAAEDFLGIDFRAVVGRAVAGLETRPVVLFEGDVTRRRSEAAAVIDDLARPDDLAVAFTTSGTTGRPKLAAHDHTTTIRHLQAAAASLRVDSEAVALLTLPFCGTFGFVSALAILAGGGRVVVADRFDPAQSAVLMERHRVTHVNGSDDMLLALLAQGRDLTSWRHGVHAEFNGRGIECVARAEQVGARVTGVYGSSGLPIS